MGVPLGIEGVDLVELDIISKGRLPAVSSDFQSALSLIHPSDTTFSRSGRVGNFPDGPSVEWGNLARMLETALTTSCSNLDDTATAIQHFLAEILEADDGAAGRMNQARAELGEVATP